MFLSLDLTFNLFSPKHANPATAQIWATRKRHDSGEILANSVYQVHLAIRSLNTSSNDSVATGSFLDLIDKNNPSGRYKIEKHLEPVECTVCLLTLEKGEKIRNLKCNHTFHKACVDKWLQQDSAVRCPLCRSTVLPEEIMVQLREQRNWSQLYEEISEEEIVFFLSSVHGGPLYSVL